MAIFRPVIFKIDDELYGIDIERVEAIERGQQVVRVPNAAKNIRGIINLRGEIIPVVSLRAKFHSANVNSTGNTELLIVSIDENKVALEVDKVDEIHDVEENNMIAMPNIAKGQGVDYFDKVAKIDNKLIIMIRPDELLSEAELAVAQKLVESMSESEE